ncbi:MAG: transposase [Saccharofermentans sp.]|nr:transposase [Saccharofermentans sp.]
MRIPLGSLIKLGLSISESYTQYQKGVNERTRAARARDEAIAETNKYNRSRLEDQIARESVSVVCPNCGSTGNRIRRGSTSYCQFCGTAIQVGFDGTIQFHKPDIEEGNE